MAHVKTKEQLVCIRLCGNKSFIFNVEDVKRLRNEHRIVGSLAGSLPRFPQQNSFYGLPLLLLPEETVMILEKGWGTLLKNDEAEVWNYGKHEDEQLKYQVYSALWQRGLYVTSGERFGGDYLAYPGDPMRFHSHYIVAVHSKDQKCSMMDLVAMGRLASNTKKTFVVACKSPSSKAASSLESFPSVQADSVDRKGQQHNDDSNTATLATHSPIGFFSITWAGF